MPYITMMQSPSYHQITFEEILSGNVNISGHMINRNESNTRTHFSKVVPQKFLDRFDFRAMIDALISFNNQYEDLFRVERATLYDRFYIPKKSGGLREINAPVPELMTALRNLKTLLETKMFALYHTSAFGYVPQRCAVDAVKKHQVNHSHWFLKIDFSNFFGNTTLEFVMESLTQIFPFSEIVKYQDGRETLEKAMSLCFLNGGLPQGTPISPMLTNLMMIPIDHRIYNCLRKFNGNSYVYTRYADDILISSLRDFDKDEIMRFIADTLAEFHAPFTFKQEKTRYGSSAGSNWNLGVMLNKDNEITIGHRNKKRLRAMISNYILDRKNGVRWELHDVQVLSGIINYYRMIEEEYVDKVVQYNNQKYGVHLRALLKEDLS